MFTALSKGLIMLAEQFAAAVAIAQSQKSLDEISRLTWRALAEAQIDETAAGAISEAIDARRVALRHTTHPKPALALPRRPKPRSPDKAGSIERRRRHAASGIVPGRIAAGFTQGETAVLTVIGRQIQQAGECRLPVDAIAALAGVCRTTVQNALRQAKAVGLVCVVERRRQGLPNLSNIITIADAGWQAWLKLAGGGGFKFVNTTNNKIVFLKENQKSGRPNDFGIDSAGINADEKHYCLGKNIDTLWKSTR